MGESGTPHEARPSQIARETFLTEGGPHPTQPLSRPAAETTRGDLRYGQAQGFLSVRGRGHPRPHRLRGQTGPCSASRHNRSHARAASPSPHRREERARGRPLA